MIILFATSFGSVSSAQSAADTAQKDYEEALLNNKKINDQLRTINTEIQAAQAKLANANRTITEAGVAVKEIEERQAELEVRIKKISKDLKGRAVNSYVSDTADNNASISDLDPVTQELRAEWILGSVIKNESELIAELKDAKDEKRIAEDIKQRTLENKEFAITTQTELLKVLEVEKGKLKAALVVIQPRIDAVSSGKMTKVRGFTVDPSIAANLLLMLDAAEADGIILKGWAFRSNQQQIDLRRKNCGSSNYAIYEMRASSCSPPTARPGRSQHEVGLAIDFTCDGARIGNSRTSPCYKWLVSNAGKYGFKNLPSEAWHWSTTGR